MSQAAQNQTTEVRNPTIPELQAQLDRNNALQTGFFSGFVAGAIVVGGAIALGLFSSRG